MTRRGGGSEPLGLDLLRSLLCGTAVLPMEYHLFYLFSYLFLVIFLLVIILVPVFLNRLHTGVDASHFLVKG